MNKPGLWADGLGERSGKCNYIVARYAFDFIYTLDREARGAFDLVDGVPWDGAHVGVNFADGNFDIEPLLKPVFVCPDGAHLRACVSFDHKERLTISLLFLFCGVCGSLRL